MDIRTPLGKGSISTQLDRLLLVLAIRYFVGNGVPLLLPVLQGCGDVLLLLVVVGERHGDRIGRGVVEWLWYRSVFSLFM